MRKDRNSYHIVRLESGTVGRIHSNKIVADDYRETLINTIRTVDVRPGESATGKIIGYIGEVDLDKLSY